MKKQNYLVRSIFLAIIIVLLILVGYVFHSKFNVETSKKVQEEYTVVNDIKDIDSDFMEFVFLALDHGIFSISDTSDWLVPFTLTQTNGKLGELDRFFAERYEEGIIKAEKHLRLISTKPDYAVLIYDGFVTIENQKYEAIIAKAYNLTETEAYIFAQRYQRTELEGEMKVVGNIIFMGRIPNLILENSVN